MTSVVIDTDTSCTSHLDDLKKRGVTAIGRYYAARGSKRLTKAEAQAISDAGLKVFIVYEDSGDPDLSVERGQRDAQIALAQAKAIGQPEGSAIYFAMEHLPHGYGPGDIPGIKLYFEGIRRTVAGAYKVGCYSNGTTLQALLEAKLIDYAWVSASTSFHGSKDFLKTDRWVLAQRKVDQNWGGVSTDTNDVQGEFGAFTLTAQTAPMEPTDAEPPTVVASDTETSPSIFSNFSFYQVNELADQGSRIAGWLRSIKRYFWGGVTTAGGAATLVNTNQGTGHAFTQIVADHPFLFVAVVGAIVAALVYVAIKCVEKYLISAAKSGRYSPR